MKFSTTMFRTGNNTGIEVPEAVVEALGAGKRPPVNVTVNGYAYRSTIAPMGGRYLIPFSADKRAETGIGGGDAIEVELTLDTVSRAVAPPEDLAAALAEAPGAAKAFAALSPGRQKAHVTSIEGAKARVTRERRIAKTVAELTP
ncbi:YdeI/OmpD-associated family protein [Streptomyces anulatus]|uniref:YdeI/OmpD-associated family protein n=1 Tax=Streptomyces TaxID=1883 RepID=UPI002069EF38|nr:MULTISPECIES: YdeI/OmpD-associated family protein [Streptomyces]UPT42101.1 YdeI/OmpD-associated family protein [Streptomyces sp. WAC00303]WIY76327.1 YdeI/OmpD-associated family protein [Streptomyces anulatus]